MFGEPYWLLRIRTPVMMLKVALDTSSVRNKQFLTGPVSSWKTWFEINSAKRKPASKYQLSCLRFMHLVYDALYALIPFKPSVRFCLKTSSRYFVIELHWPGGMECRSYQRYLTSLVYSTFSPTTFIILPSSFWLLKRHHLQRTGPNYTLLHLTPKSALIAGFIYRSSCPTSPYASFSSFL